MNFSPPSQTKETARSLLCTFSKTSSLFSAEAAGAVLQHHIYETPDSPTVFIFQMFQYARYECNAIGRLPKLVFLKLAVFNSTNMATTRSCEVATAPRCGISFCLFFLSPFVSFHSSFLSISFKVDSSLSVYEGYLKIRGLAAVRR
jgi:hypothetical protein